MNSRKVLLKTFCIHFFLCWFLLTSNLALAADKTVCASGCDEVTIQAGINACDATGGGTVTVTDSGTYSGPITMKDGVNLVTGALQTPTINGPPPGPTGGLVGFTGPMTCNLTGFTIQPFGTGSGIFVNGSGGKVTVVTSCRMIPPR